MDRAAVEGWIRAHVDPVDALEITHERPWATVLRVPLADGVAWFKACAAVAWARQRDHLPEQDRRKFDRTFAIVLRRAIARTVD